MSFAFFPSCSRCVGKQYSPFCDQSCVVCKKIFCESCSVICVACEEIVCSNCYVFDRCCVVASKGTSEKALAKFYDEKLVQYVAFHAVHSRLLHHKFLGSKSPHVAIRKNALRKTARHFVFNHDCAIREGNTLCRIVLAKFFPRLAEFKSIVYFKSFMRKLLAQKRFLFCEILCFSPDKKEMIELLESSIREDKEVRHLLELTSFTAETDLIEVLRER